MIIEIHGGGFKNKGAELMLVSILKKFSENYPEVKFCINPSVYDDSSSCKKYGLLEYVKVPKARGGRLFLVRFLLNRVLGKLITRKYCDNHGLVRFSDVDALIDISGVRFSDKASLVAGENFIQLARYFRKRGKPVILLPQMFGPFDNSESYELMERVGAEASLIFSRDQMSFDYVEKVLPLSPVVFKAPDITIPTKPNNIYKSERKYGCIVPNVRMFDRGDLEWSGVYIKRLAIAAHKMHLKGIEPVILIHSIDSTEDQPLAEAVKEIVGENICSVKFADDPIETKSFIAGSELVVGSRYHSIVSALSSGVPAIVMGWAHKYETILEDFDMGQFIHKANNDENHLSEILEFMLDEKKNKELREILENKIKHMLIDNKEMWDKVFITLGLSN